MVLYCPLYYSGMVLSFALIGLISFCNSIFIQMKFKRKTFFSKFYFSNFIHDFIYVYSRDTEKRFFAGSDRFLVCKTDCIKRIFFGPKKTHFADHILAQFPGLVKCQTVNCP